MTTSLKKAEILDAAQEIIQLQGYNGFSFADIAETVGIRKASIHHHFKSKAALGLAVMRRYREEFKELLNTADKKGVSGIDKIQNYAKLYENTLTQNKLCLCGMLSADINTLPKTMKKEIHHFFDENIEWLLSVLKRSFTSLTAKTASDLAWCITSSLQGGILLARAQNQPLIFTSIWRELLARLKAMK